jgi:hypothetical protein
MAVLFGDSEERTFPHSCQLSLFQRDSPTFIRAVPPKISIVVPPTDVGYNDHIRKSIDLIWKCPYFDPQIPLLLQMRPYFWFWQVGNYVPQH